MDDMSEFECAMLTDWTRRTIDAGFHAGFITPPWRPTAGAYEQLAGYYASGLMPEEGAQAMFATHH